MRSLTVFLLVLTVFSCERPHADPERKERSRRIAVMAPAAAEMLEALGAIDLVVATGDYVSAPETLTRLPRLGAYDAPNLERIVELDVDLYVTTASRAGVAAHERMARLDVEVLALDTDTFEGVFASLVKLGEAIGRRDAAARIADGIRAELAEIRERASAAPRRRVLFAVGRDPLFLAGPGSHVDEMIRLVGGVNVIDDAGSPWPRTSMEAALERMPEVVIDTSHNRADARRGRAAGEWAQWSFLPAVRDDRVYHVDPQLLVIPGMRLPKMTRLMGKLVQPEIFGETTAGELSVPRNP